MHSAKFSSDITVELVKHSAHDADIVFAARVSTEGERSKDITDNGNIIPESKDAGLINYLMRERHGCYDSKTDVLTSDGWKNWKDVDGTELFYTLNLDTGLTEYQTAQRHIRKQYSGPMVHFKMNSVDLLVTPDHNVVAQVRRKKDQWKPASLMPAFDLVNRPGRFLMSSGNWNLGTVHSPEVAELVGFIAADGSYTGSSISFHLHKKSKIQWLTSRHKVTEGACGRFWLTSSSEDLRRWAKQTYDENGDRCIPRELLVSADAKTARALLSGYLVGDGSISSSGKITASTVSRRMVNDLQELAIKCGIAAVETSAIVDRESAYGNRPLYRITFYRDRNIFPRLGWTKKARTQQVVVEDYEGEIHCVTVPNGTLYVRRNGKPVWSGNSPFEHSYFTFYVKAPIFVWREHMRHRIASYNEESGRYRVLNPEFYIPPRDRKLQQIGKTGQYTFVEGTDTQYAVLLTTIKRNCENAYTDYRQLLNNGIAKEIARITLPINIYSSAYVTMNARALMNFLSLRRHVEGSHFPSYPQREIELVAEEYEKYFAEFMPITHDAFEKNGRVAP